MIFNPIIVGKGGAKRYKIANSILVDMPSEAEAGAYVTGKSLGPMLPMKITDDMGNSIPYSTDKDQYDVIVTFVMPASDVVITRADIII